MKNILIIIDTDKEVPVVYSSEITSGLYEAVSKAVPQIDIDIPIDVSAVVNSLSRGKMYWIYGRICIFSTLLAPEG